MEFKRESYILFDKMVDSIYDDIINYLMRIVRVIPEKEEKEALKAYANLSFIHNDMSAVDGKDGKAKEKDGNFSGNKIKKRYKVKKNKVSIQKGIHMRLFCYSLEVDEFMR